MNDYAIGRLARERQADYMREVERDELVAQLHRAEAAAAAGMPVAGGPLVAGGPPVTRPVHHLWRRVLAHLAPSHLAAHGHRS